MPIDFSKRLSAEVEFEKVSKDLSSGCGFSRVRILKRDDGSILAKTAFHILQILFDFLSCLFPDGYKNENRATIEYFFKVFGEKRVRDISKTYDLDIDVKHTHGISLSKNDVRGLMTALAVVRMGDIQSIFDEIQRQEAPTSFRHLTPDETQKVWQRFKQRKFSNLTDEEMQFLQRVAAPHMTNLKTVFLHDVPRYDHPGFDRGLTIHGLQTTVCDLFRLKDLRDSTDFHRDERQLVADMITTKHLLGPNSPEGMMIFQPEGLRYLHGKFQGGGAYGAFVKAVHKTQTFRSQVIFFCTQFDCIKNTWEAAIEDLKVNIGAVGAKSVFDTIFDEVSHPSKRFVARNSEKFDVLGFSLGGAQASRFVTAMSHLNRVRKLTTMAAPKVDYLTNEFFNANLKNPMEIVEIRDRLNPKKVDHSPFAGDVSLGSTSSKVSYKLMLAMPKTDQSPMTAPNFHGNPFDAAHIVWRSIATVHGQVLPISSVRFHTVKNDTEDGRRFIKLYCDNGNHGIEPIRKPFSKFFDPINQGLKDLVELFNRHNWQVPAGFAEKVS